MHCPTTVIGAHQAHTYLRIDIRDLLDRTSLTRALVLGSNDAAVGTLSELFAKLVLRVDDERRFESGECVPLHDFVRRSTSAFKRGKRSDYDSAPLRWRTRNENARNRGTVGIMGTARVFTMFGLTVAPSKVADTLL